MSAAAKAAHRREVDSDSLPTLALRRGLSGGFVDLHLLPALLADFDGFPP